MIASASLALGIITAPRLIERTIRYEVGGVVMEGFLARPANRAILPGVVIVHDWDGVNEYEISRTKQIASEMGYAAMAIDVYGIDNRPKTMADNAKMAGAMYADRPLFRQRLAAGADALKKFGGVIPDQVVVMGYCFGGAGALELARSGYPLKGAASFHGSLDTTMKAKKGDIKGKVIAYHATQDPVVPMAQLTAFLQEMNEAEVDCQVLTFNLKAHAFTNPKGRDYSPSGDRRSWASFGLFLKEAFNRDNP
jgi:dienelactone hydrolase